MIKAPLSPCLKTALIAGTCLLHLACTQPSAQTTLSKSPSNAASIKVKITTPPTSQRFHSQASLDGKPAKEISQIQSFRVFLIASANTPTPGALNIAHGPFTIARNLSGNSQVITFSNITTGNFYVGVAAFDQNTVFDSTSNLTNLGSDYQYAEGSCYLSHTGGVNGNTGRVEVGNAPTYSVTGTAQLEVDLHLKDAEAAQIETQITVVNGANGPDRVPLGSAEQFVILAKSGVTNVSPSLITGDLGVSPIALPAVTGFAYILDSSGSFASSSQVNGKLYGADLTAPTPAYLSVAVSDMEAAYTNAAGRISPDFTNLGSGNLGGLTLIPGLYKWTSAVTISADLTLAGGPNDVWIFQSAGGINQTAATTVHLSGGAQARNIFWQTTGPAALGTNAHFEGILLSQTGITLGTGASVNGRLLAQTAVTLQQNTVAGP